MFALEEKLSIIMVDPSVVTSDLHLRRLFNLKQKLFIPATLVFAVKKQKVNEILKYFVWSNRPTRLSPEYFRLAEKAEIYEYKEENVEGIIQQLMDLRLPEYVKRILLEEYSFLKEHSALLLRFRKTIQYFKRIGIWTLDATKKLKAEKQRILRQKRVKFTVAILLECSKNLVQDPLWKTILNISKEIIITFDP